MTRRWPFVAVAAVASTAAVAMLSTIGDDLRPDPCAGAGSDSPQYWCWLLDHPDELVPATVADVDPGAGSPAPTHAVGPGST